MESCQDLARLLRKPYFALYQLYIKLKTKKLLTTPGNVLPLNFVFSLSQNSNVDNILPDLDKIPTRPFLILRSL